MMAKVQFTRVHIILWLLTTMIFVNNAIAKTGPVITANPLSLTMMSTTYGTPSAAQSFTVSGTGMTSDITVTAPTGYEVSLSSGSGYSRTSISLTQVSGTVNATLIYVRIASNASASTSNFGNVKLTGTGATTVNVAVSGHIDALLLTLKANQVNKPYGATLSSVNNASTAFTISPALPNNETLSGTVEIDYLAGYNATDGIGTYPGDVVTKPLTFSQTGGSATVSNYTMTDAGSGLLAVTGPALQFFQTPISVVDASTHVDLSGVFPSAAAPFTLPNTTYYTPSATPRAGTYGVAPISTCSFYVYGQGLSAAVTISVPLGSNFEISTSNTSGFTNSITTSAPAAGIVAGGIIYVRLKGGLLPSATPYTDIVTIATPQTTFTPATTQTLHIAGTVNKAPVTITARPVNKPYGTLLSPSSVSNSTAFTTTGFVNGDGIGTVTINYNDNATNPVGADSITTINPLSVTYIGTTDPNNYIITFKNGAVNVSGALITVTSNPATVPATNITTLTVAGITYSIPLAPTDPSISSFIVYGQGLANDLIITAPSGFEVGMSISPNQVDWANVSFSPTVDLPASNGKASATILIRLTKNASATSQTGTVTVATAANAGVNDPALSKSLQVSGTVSPLPVTATANAQTKVYGAADPALTYVVTTNPGYLTTSPGLQNGDILSGSLTRAPGESVGQYNITDPTSGGLSNSNYSITYAPANLTITPAALTITANSKSKFYGQADPSLTYQLSSPGLLNGDVLSGSLTRAPGETLSGGPYLIISTLNNPNYTITYVPANLTITPAALTITANSKSKLYGQGDPSLTYQISSPGLLNGDVLSGSLTRAPGETVSGGPYLISSTLNNPNYTITYVPANLTISPAALTITANSKSKLYGQADPSLTFQISSPGLLNGDVLSGGLARAPGETVSGGPYLISSTLNNPNYTINYVPANLTITPAALTITANSKSKFYGQADPSLTYQLSSPGLLNGDVLSGSLVRASGETVSGGPYLISSNLNNSNYIITYVPANLTISPVALTITASNQTRAYGSANPTLTVSYTGFVNGDGPGNITTPPNVSTSATTTSSIAGSPYAITPSSAVDANYTISYVPGLLTITPATLTVTANNQTKTYGSANPALTVSYTGFVNGDGPANLTTTPSITTSANTTSSVTGSPYPITPSTAVAPNYTINYVPGLLTITPAPLTITADSKSILYGQANPTLTISYSGFVNNENPANLTQAPTIYTSVTTTSAPGVYPISLSGAASPNYNITLINGTLKVIGSSIINLTNLITSIGTLSPVFSQATTSYVVVVPGPITALTVTASFDPTETAAIYGLSIPNGSPSRYITLNSFGDTAIPVVITAQDGVTQITYLLTIKRADIEPDNVITPNGDGRNDVWVIKNIDTCPNNSVTIYDRAGRQVYTKRGYTNDWAGTANNKPLAEGTYFYTLDLGLDMPAIKGFINIIRSR